MKKLVKLEMNHEELIFGVHKTFSAMHLLEKNQIDEAQQALTFALQVFDTFFKTNKDVNWIPIAHEIANKRAMVEGENWAVNNFSEDDIVILRQLLPLKEYSILTADALKALLTWKDKIYAQKQLQSALETLSYELTSLSR